MSKSLKIILAGLVGLLLFIVVALLIFVDADAVKRRVETAASKVLGMEVEVAGRVGFGLVSGPSVTLGDVHIRNRGADILTAKEATLGVRLLPLLRKEVQVAKIVLKHPGVYIERGKDGKYNFEKPKADDEVLPALDLAKVSLSDATLIYADKQAGGGFEAADCSMDVRSLLLSGGERVYQVKNLSLTAELACGEIRTKKITVSDLKLSVAGKDGVLDFKPVRMNIFGGQGSGSIRADFSRAAPHYQVRYSLPQFRVEQYFKTLSPQKVAEGQMNFSANLTMQGKTLNEMKRTTNGQASLRGDKLTLNGHDLDQEFSRFESSQTFNLVDVGAFFFAGPVGVAVTKGYDFATLFKGKGGVSVIRTLVSDWKIEGGVAHAQDVAMATNKHRIALHGGLDFVNENFNDVTVALIDARGCAEARQKIRGPFMKPVVEKPNILRSLAGPALKLLKKGRKLLLPGKECAVFYSGSVAPPE